MDSNKHHRLSAAGVLVALGIIYGDIGTSPIYTLRFIVGQGVVTEDLILGGLSCVFWTLTLITSLKYVYLALEADNKG
ncbi:MAG: KUP/HAK/KT family potassium transporter, partial [Cytophagales bacterium]